MWRKLLRNSLNKWGNNFAGFWLFAYFVYLRKNNTFAI